MVSSNAEGAVWGAGPPGSESPMTTSIHRSGRIPADQTSATARLSVRRAAGAAAVVLCFLALPSCGDDDDSPDQTEGPAPTGANQSPEGNVDVTMSIAEPDVAGSNLGALSSQAPYNS